VEELRQKKSRAEKKGKKKMPRNGATEKELLMALGFVDQIQKKPLKAAQDKIALIILYLTGLRVSNLRLISVGSLKAFSEGKDLTIPLIKNKQSQFYLSL